MRRVPTLIATAFLAALLGTSAGARPEGAKAHACTLQWSRVASPHTPDGVLVAVSAAAPSDAWAVGYSPSKALQRPELGPPNTPLIEHWDGHGWRLATPPGHSALFSDVAAVSPNNVWVAGDQGVLRWNGRRWTTSASPSGWDVHALSATAADDVWAIASADPHVAILHWTGHAWKVAHTWTGIGLADIAAVSSRDVWAVGRTGALSDSAPLLVHWDGRSWWKRVLPRPHNTDALGWGLAAVVASPTEAWAVGSAGSQEMMRASYPLVIRAGGAHAVGVAPPKTHGMPYLNAVAAPDMRTIWVAGADTGYWQDGGAGTFLSHRSGTAWQTTPLRKGEVVDDLAPDRAGGLWAVGLKGSGSGENGFPTYSTPLILRLGC